MDTQKRVFDLVVTLVLLPVWLPVCLLAGLCLWLTAGWPVFYGSRRRVLGRRSQRVWKFRTMVRDAERLINRETVPITDTCFLNIPPEHPVYTPVGRMIERYALTELPQLVHVLAGSMSLVGNRPLPENVIQALVKRYGYAEDRFLAPTGLTGPVQLVGRQLITDAERLAIEIDYCLLSVFRYRARLDLVILWNTVLVALRLRAPFTVAEVRSLMAVAAEMPSADDAADGERRRAALRLPADGQPTLTLDGESFLLREFGYRGLRVIGERTLAIGRFLAVAGERSPGELRARVCWSRGLADGRFESGLAVDPSHGSALSLVQLVRGAPGAHAVDRPAVTPPIVPAATPPARAGVPVPGSQV